MAKSSLEEQVRQAGKRYVSIRTIADALEKKPHDYKARIALGNLIHEVQPAESADLPIGASNDAVDNYSGRYLEDLENSLNEVVKGKLKRVLGMIEKDGLLDLVFSIMPYKTGDEEHDRIADIHERFIKLAVGVKTEDFSPYLASVTTDNAKKAMAYRIKASPEAVLRNMAEYAKELQTELKDQLEKRGESYIRDYILRSYKKSNEDQRRDFNIKAGSLVKSK